MLALDRWESYQKLQHELEHLERRLDKRAQAEARRRWRIITRDAAERMRMKGRDV